MSNNLVILFSVLFISYIIMSQAFFSGYSEVMSEFRRGLDSGLGAGIPAGQLESMGRRLEAIPVLAPKRLIHLKYLEHKARIYIQSKTKFYYSFLCFTLYCFSAVWLLLFL